MKKIFLGLTILTIVLLLSGCSKENGNNENNYIDKIGSYYKTSTIKCDVLENIKYMDDNIIITNDDKGYIYSIYDLYSNNQNCKEVYDFKDEPILAQSIYYMGGTNKVFITNDSVYDFDYEKITIQKRNDDYATRSLFDKPINDDFYYFKMISFTVMAGEIPMQNYNVVGLKNDENIYFNDEIIFTSKDDETIRYFYTTQESQRDNGNINELSLVLTSKNLYVLKSKLINKDCEKYADIKCEYENTFEVDTSFKNNISDIVYINNSYGSRYFVLKNGKVYIDDTYYP